MLKGECVLAVCAFLRGSVQMAAVFWVHLLFLTCKIMHNHMRNFVSCSKYSLLCICIFLKKVITKLTIHLKDGHMNFLIEEDEPYGKKMWPFNIITNISKINMQHFDLSIYHCENELQPLCPTWFYSFEFVSHWEITSYLEGVSKSERPLYLFKI